MLSIYNVSAYTLPEERAAAEAKFTTWLHDLGETWIIASPVFTGEWLEQIAAAAHGPVHLYVAASFRGEPQPIFDARAAGLDVIIGAELSGFDCGMVVQSYSTTRVWLGDPPADQSAEATVLCFDSTDYGTRFRRRFDALAAAARRDYPDLNPMPVAAEGATP